MAHSLLSYPPAPNTQPQCSEHRGFRHDPPPCASDSSAVSRGEDFSLCHSFMPSVSLHWLALKTKPCPSCQLGIYRRWGEGPLESQSWWRAVSPSPSISKNLCGASTSSEGIPARTQHPSSFSEREARGAGLLGTTGKATCIVLWPEFPSGRRHRQRLPGPLTSLGMVC